MKKDNLYFKKIYQDLKKSGRNGAARPGRLDFADLKILEYWVRIIRNNPESLNKEIAIHLVSEPYRNGIVNGFIETLGAYIKPTRTASKNASRRNSTRALPMGIREKNSWTTFFWTNLRSLKTGRKSNSIPNIATAGS